MVGRILVDFLVDFLLNFVFFWTGEILLAIFTAGRHQIRPRTKYPGMSTLLTSVLVGIIFWLSIGIIIYLVR